MPNDEARSKILQEHSAKFKHDLTDGDWETLGQESIGFTGQDCAEVVKLAAGLPLQRCQAATRFKKTKDGGWIPTSPGDLEGQDMSVIDIHPKLIRIPPMDIEDFR